MPSRQNIIVGGAILGSALLVAWTDERTAKTDPHFYKTPREDFTLYAIAQRKLLADRYGFMPGTVWNGKTPGLPVTSNADAQKVVSYWFAKLAEADRARDGQETGEAAKIADMIGTGPALVGTDRGGDVKSGQRVAAFERELAALSEEVNALPFGGAAFARVPASWRKSMTPAQVERFWFIIDRAAFATHAALSVPSGEPDVLWRYMKEEASTIPKSVGSWLAGAGEWAGEVAAKTTLGVLQGVLSHPVFLAGTGIALTLWLRRGAS